MRVVLMGRLVCALLAVLLCTGAGAQDNIRSVRLSGDILAAGLPLSALTVTLIKKDYKGTLQLVYSGTAAFAATYVLKYTVNKVRPDRSNSLSFPSAHTAAGFAAAAFLHRRYGIWAGIPAYAVSTYIGWSRIYARKHDIWDVAAGAAIGAASAFIFTRPWAQEHRFALSPVVIDGRAGASFSMVF